MAAPNIINVTTILGKTTYATPADTNAAVLLANSASSGKVFKINSLVASNVDGTNATNVTVAINTNASGTGTGYPIASTISCPADASLVVIDKDNPYYLEEDKSIVVTSGAANDITFTVSYEEIS
jgi:hypothetical protein